ISPMGLNSETGLDRPRLSPRRAACVRQGVAEATIAYTAVRPDVGEAGAIVPAAATIFVSRFDLALAWPGEVEEGALAVDLPRHRVIGPRGLLGCVEVWRAPRVIADRGTEAAGPDLLNSTKAEPVVMRAQRVALQGRAGGIRQ